MERIFNYNIDEYDERNAVKIGRILLKNKDVNNILITVISEYFNIDPIMIITRSRNAEYINFKHVYRFMCCHFTTYSLKAIGIKSGYFDHATIINSVKQVNNFCDTDKIYKQDIDSIFKLIEQNITENINNQLNKLIC